MKLNKEELELVGLATRSMELIELAGQSDLSLKGAVKRALAAGFDIKVMEEFLKAVGIKNI